MANDEIEPEENCVTYGATIRPGSDHSHSVEGLGSHELDEWLVAHGESGDAFTYFSVGRDGDILVRGEGKVEDGEAFYRLAR